MRIAKLFIKEFKNLRDFSIDFNEESPTVLIGKNGSGKSYVIEALVSIFRNLDLNYDPPFVYQLEYVCRDRRVAIDADPSRSSKRLQFWVDGQTVARKSFDRRYLPNHVFGYYSGTSNRLESYFDRHQELFYEDLINNRPQPLRPLFYARDVHSHFVLLAFFGQQDEYTARFLEEYLGVRGLESILFVLRDPDWNRRRSPRVPARSQDGELLFWGAEGAVNTLLHKLYEQSLAPLVLTRRVREDFRSHSDREYLYLYLKDQDALEQIVKSYESQQDFFKATESTYVSDLIDEVRVKIRVKTAGEFLTFRELSEGEQQLLTVLGLLRFTRDEESLFLLDEPDTHTNPAWSYEYLTLLTRALDDTQSSHIIMTTHDPLIISGLRREQVHILYRGSKTGQVTVTLPEHDPKGMGVAGILTSEFFGLRSTLDPETLRQLDQKRDLAYRQEPLNEEELAALRELEDELADVDYASITRDPLYEPYVRAMEQNSEYQRMKEKTILEEGDRDKIRELAEEVLRDLTK